MKQKLLLAKRDKLSCEAIKFFLEREKFTVITECVQIDRFMTIIEIEKPHVIILDGSMFYNRNTSLINTINKLSTIIKVILITDYYDEVLLADIIRGSVKGVMLRDGGLDSLLTCLTVVLNEGIYICPSFQDFHKIKEYNQTERYIFELLTYRELEILEQIKQNKTSRDIAKSLNLSVRTIQNYRSKIMHKLGLNGANALTKFVSQMH